MCCKFYVDRIKGKRVLKGQLFDNMLPLTCESISILVIATPEISIKSTVIQVLYNYPRVVHLLKSL